MRVGLIADIHANLPALQAALAALADCETILCAGDIVGYYTEPNEVCALLRECRVICIRGNHDAYVTGALQPKPGRDAQYRTAWTRDNLTTENRRWLAQLPMEMRFDWRQGDAGCRLTMRHASPWDEETYLYPDTRLDNIALEADEILLLGHTHHPMKRHAGAGIVVNPGSVGQPRHRQPGADAAILETERREVTFLRAGYDISAYQEKLAAASILPEIAAMLSRTA